MFISIIIPTLNESACIEDTIRFLLLHGGAAVREILVVDGGSTDQTTAIARSAGATVISTKQGRAVQMNCGARNATGDILYFVHADALPPVSFATDILHALENGYVVGCFRYKFNSGKLLLRINAWFTRFHWLFCQGGDKTFFIRATDFWALGGYNEQLVIMEEYDFLQRLLKKGIPLLILSKYVIVSARKYNHNSWLRVQLANLLVFNLWRWQLAQPATLKALYKKILLPY